MIHELILYLSEKVDPKARAFGHLKESIALIKRQKRCESFWKTHQNNCQELILDTISKLPNHQRILILGSGPLHEIPLLSIANKFKEVLLVDIVHLKQIKKKYAHLKNVNFIEHDVSEIEEIILKEKKLINLPPKKFLDEDFDLVISANLLSQLAYHHKKFAEKKLPHENESAIDQFCYQITKDHFDYLNKFKCTVLIYTDIETFLYNPRTNITEIETPYINFSLPKFNSEWIWNLAPTPEINPQISLQMKVVSIILNT